MHPTSHACLCCLQSSITAWLVPPFILTSPPLATALRQVLTDYEALTRVFHNIESSALRTCSHTGTKQLVQTCKWAFLMFRWAPGGILMCYRVAV